MLIKAEAVVVGREADRMLTMELSVVKKVLMHHLPQHQSYRTGMYQCWHWHWHEVQQHYRSLQKSFAR